MIQSVRLTEGQLGTDAAGTVVAVGAKVYHVEKGDRVAVFTPGAYCTRIRTHQGCVAKLPHGLALEEAATLPSLLLSAYHIAFNICRLNKRDSILVVNAESCK